jgi:precorrin-6B methylase 1
LAAGDIPAGSSWALNEMQVWSRQRTSGQVSCCNLRDIRLARAGVDGERVQEIALFGRPNEDLRRLADEKRVDLIIVGGRPRKPGPHSLGKTARFLIDHAQRAILMVRQDG